MLVTADDTAFHDCDKDLNSLINRQEHDSLLAIEWFENNIKLNQDKYENVFAFVGQSVIWETENKKLLGIITDRKLNFSDYVASICKQAGKTLCDS